MSTLLLLTPFGIYDILMMKDILHIHANKEGGELSI